MTELEKWEQRFREPGYHFGDKPSEFLQRHSELLQGGRRALSVADGEGRNGVWLAEQGLDVTSVDFSPSGVAKAEQLARMRGVTINAILADITEWQWPLNAYDVIVMIFAQFLDPETRQRVFRHIDLALEPGGLLLIEGYGLKQLEFKTGGPSEPENLYTKDLLSQSFGHFASVHIEEYEADLNEGSRHVGRSALVDLIARK